MIRDINGLIDSIIADIRNKTDIAVLGLSGGVCSTVVACLCVKALGKENVFGLSLPNDLLDRETSNFCSTKLAEKLGIQHKLVGINIIAEDIDCATWYVTQQRNPINVENSKSRARLAVLYGVSHNLRLMTGKRVVVLGTMDLSKKYIGYFTKYGDGGIESPIDGLFRSEVCQLLDYFKEQSFITDDLVNKNSSEMKELEYSYSEMEPYIRHFLKLSVPKEDIRNKKILNFVKNRHIQNNHKLLSPEVFQLRDFCEPIGVVYLVTNRVNGKRYVGKTCQNFEEYKKIHIWRAFTPTAKGYNRVFYRALRKYSPENFTWEILFKGDEAVLFEKEKFYIKMYNTFINGGHGYNMTLGGEGASGMTYKWSENSKLKIRGEGNHRFGKHLTQDQKTILSSFNKNRVKSEQEKEKIRQTLLKKHPTKKVIDYSLLIDLFYDGISFKEIIDKYNIIKNVNFSSTPFKRAFKKLGIILNSKNQYDFIKNQKEFTLKNDKNKIKLRIPT